MLFVSPRKSVLLLLIIVLFAFFTSCKSSGTGPEDNVPAGRRDYVWTVDTLNKLGPYNNYTLLFGTSPTNIWCVGVGYYSDRFLRYDGQKWSFLKGVGAFDPRSIFGLDENDIWFGGYDGSIWHYTNGKFDKVGTYPIAEYGEAVYQCIWGETKNDIFASGCIYSSLRDKIYGILMHYNGKKWEYVLQPSMLLQFQSIKRGIKSSDNYFLIGITNSNSPDSSIIFSYDGNNLKRIYYEEYSLFTAPGMIVLNDYMYFAFKEKLFKYFNNQFQLVRDFSGNNIKHLGKISGRSVKDLFFDLNGGIGHYNGTDIKPIYSYDNTTQIFASLHLENESYFLCFDRMKKEYLLIHGSLKR